MLDSFWSGTSEARMGERSEAEAGSEVVRAKQGESVGLDDEQNEGVQPAFS